MKFVFGMLASIYLLAGATLADTNAALNSRFQGYYDALHAAFTEGNAQGLIAPDHHCLGIEVNDQLQVIDADSRAVPGLYCVGPLLKARFWEATAVPELREHARRVTNALLQSLKP